MENIIFCTTCLLWIPVLILEHISKKVDNKVTANHLRLVSNWLLGAELISLVYCIGNYWCGWDPNSIFG